MRKRGLATLPKREGHLRTRRRKCFIPTKYIGTTRLPNGGSCLFVSVPANHPHGLLLFAAVKRVAPTGRSVHRGDLAGGGSHRITAVGEPIRRWDAFAHHRKLVFVQSARGKGEAKKAAPQDACVHRGGVMQDSYRGKHLRLLVRKCPSPLRRFSRTPFAKGVLEAAFFPGVSLQKQRNPEKRINLIKPHFNTLMPQTSLNSNKL